MNIIQPSLLKLYAISFIFLGLVSFGFSSFLYLKPEREAQGVELIKINRIKSCNEKANALGFSSTSNLKLETVDVMYGQIDEWKGNISKFSYLIKSCQGMELEYFCMGRSCKNSNDQPVYGVSLSLKYIKPIISK